MAICSALGGPSIQDGDNFKHNTFYCDLIKYSWPLAYDQTGQTMHHVYLIVAWDISFAFGAVNSYTTSC